MSKPMTGTQKGCAVVFWVAILLVGGLITIGECSGPSPTSSEPDAKTAATLQTPPIAYSGDGPTDWHREADTAFQALLKSCPTLRGAIATSPKVELSWQDTTSSGFQHLYGWKHMILVEADLSDQVMEAAPAWFRDPQWGNHVLIRLGAGRASGANLDWPTDLWLCGMDDELGQQFLDGKTRSWPQRNVLKPIPELTSVMQPKLDFGHQAAWQRASSMAR